MRVISTFFLILLCAFSFQAHAQDDGSILDIQSLTSESGIEIWLVEDHSVPVIALRAGFKNSGTAYDPQDKQGLARLASNTMDEGAAHLSAQNFQKELRDNSISLFFNADRDSFGASLKTLSKNKERAFELLELALSKPRFEAEAVERMRNANQSRIRNSLTDPSWMAARLMNDIAFEDHPYAMNSGGTLSGLDNINSDDLKAFHSAHIGKNNLEIAIAGDITAEEAIEIVDETFGGLPDVELETLEDLKIQNTGHAYLYERDIPQSVIRITFQGLKKDDPDYFAAQVMNFILGSSGFGSRLTEEIREKRGLTYGIYSSLYNLEHVSALIISTSTANENVAEMIELINKELSKIAEKPVSEKELKDAQSYLLGSLPLELTSTDKIADLLLALKLDNLPLNYLDQRAQAIEAMNVEAVQASAKKLLADGGMNIVIVGQPSALNLDINEIDSLPNVE